MGQNLKARLQLIRKAGKSVPRDTPEKQAPPPENNSEPSWPGWTEAGYMTLKRKLTRELPFPVPVEFPAALTILVPDIARMGRLPIPAELLFFDLETTGLSGGAGTLAFLAAFGRFLPPGESTGGATGGANAQIEITQYLLLDYPGEGDFIEMAVKEFTLSHSTPLVVSYNGKSFDSQILKNRCLMNGIMPPDYYHADLLHPARRLWKRLLPDCSQATIEVSVLGLDRTGDVPGALAPEIWFSFLRDGGNRHSSNSELLGICDHNVRDIAGLASLFLSVAEIAAEPFESQKKYRFDEEALALAWRAAMRKNAFPGGDGELYRNLAEAGERLLESAAKNGGQRAAFVLASDYFKNGRSGEGRALMEKITEDTSSPLGLRIAAFRALAIDAEWRLRDIPLALRFTGNALALPEISVSHKAEFEKRRERLEGKIIEKELTQRR